jgi:SnoaL-like domain
LTLAVEDRVFLRGLVDAYADAVDRRDAVAFPALFVPDGVLRVQTDDGPVEAEYRGHQLVASFDVLAPFYRTFHHVGGAVFAPLTPGDDDRASGRVHCLAHHYERTRNGPVDLVMMIRYMDSYVRQSDGAWLIGERQVAIQWTELHAAHPPRRPRVQPSS